PSLGGRVARRMALLAACSLLLAPTALAQTPAALGDRGDYAAAWEKASSVQTAAMQTTAARAASDEVVYHLALEGAPLAEELTWLDRAVTAGEAAVKLDPTSAAAVVQLARAKGEIARRSGILQNLGVAPELKGLFDKALRLDPNNADALVGLAMWHLELVENGVGWLYGGRKDAVEPLLAKGIAAAPDQVNLRVEYARALIALGKPAEARVQLEKALSLPAARASDEVEKQAATNMLQGLGT
ncbi:MAG TPA: hypothetical protein PLT07_01665, partial [Trueperaceae bacterium]|nr:hypothetical protein [Trueperaceae bacterium]